ncbi:hypothetical protein Tco_1051045, partial [Tanacetum coccineum]
LAPSGGGWIIYQAYGNLYAMTGKKGYLLKDKQIPSVEVFSTWMTFRGNTRDLGSFREEMDTTTDLHQNILKTMHKEREDGITNNERRRRNLLDDGVTEFMTTLGHSCLNADLEDST